MPDPIAGSQPGDSSEPLHGIAFDHSWSRLGSRDLPSRGASFTEWLNVHPRLAGAAYFEAQASTKFTHAALGQNAPSVPDWAIPANAAMNVTGALYTNGLTGVHSNANDRFFFYGNDAGSSSYLGIAGSTDGGATGGLYTAAPTITRVPIGSLVNGSALAVNVTGRYVYAAGTDGKVYGVDTCAGVASGCTPGILTGWPATITGKTIVWSSPWYDYGSNKIYIGTSGGLAIIDATSPATAPIVVKLGAGGFCHGTPVLYNGFVWIGCDDHNLYSVRQSDNSVRSATPLCSIAGAACGANDAIWGAPFIDTTPTKANILIAEKFNIVQVPANDATNGCAIVAGAAPQPCSFSNPKNRWIRRLSGGGFTAAAAVQKSSAFVDFNNGTGGTDTSFVYVSTFGNGSNGALVLWNYPINGGQYLTAAYPAGAQNSNSSPLALDNPNIAGSPTAADIFVGDAAGNIEHASVDYFNATISLTSSKVFGATTFTRIDSSPVADFAPPAIGGAGPGNVYFSGASSAPTAGAYVQFSQTAF